MCVCVYAHALQKPSSCGIVVPPSALLVKMPDPVMGVVSGEALSGDEKASVSVAGETEKVA